MKGMLALAAAAAPAAALACAACARDASPLAWLLVAGLIAAPYGIALGVVRVIRSAEREGRP